MPDPFSCPPLVKKLTVSGTIGKTQGVNKEMSPPKNPITRSNQKLLFYSSISPHVSMTGELKSRLSILGIIDKVELSVL